MFYYTLCTVHKKANWKNVSVLSAMLLNNPPFLSLSFLLGKHFLCSLLVVEMEERLAKRASCCCQRW